MFKVGWTTPVTLPYSIPLVRVSTCNTLSVQHVHVVGIAYMCAKHDVRRNHQGTSSRTASSQLLQHCGNGKCFYQPRSRYQSPRAGLLADTELMQQEEAKGETEICHECLHFHS